MNIRLNKKSIIMVPYIILVASIIIFGIKTAQAKENKFKPAEFLPAFITPGGNTIASGIVMPNAGMQQIMCADRALPAMCVNVYNSGMGDLMVYGMMVGSETHELIRCGEVGPGQTKAVCLGPNFTSVAIMMTDGDQNRGRDGFAGWRVDMVHEDDPAPE